MSNLIQALSSKYNISAQHHRCFNISDIFRTQIYSLYFAIASYHKRIISIPT